MAKFRLFVTLAGILSLLIANNKLFSQDKHAKQLASKLAARLARCESERQWNDVAYAIGLLPHKDEEIQKLIGEGFRVLQAAA